MKPPPFDYVAPDSLEGVLAALGEHGDDAKVLAGGQSLVPLLALRLARPEVLVDVGCVRELADVSVDDGHLVIGAMVRQRAAERSELMTKHVPLLAAALPFIGHRAIRSRGTIGGSLAHADPAAEIPTVMLACDAELVAVSASGGERTIAVEEFFDGFLTTTLAPEEVLTAVRVPSTPAAAGTAFVEAARRHGDFAMVGVAATVERDADRITRARIAVAGAADRPVRRPEAEALLVGGDPSDEAFRAAGAAAASGLEPPSDLHGSSAYRAHLVQVLVRRALEEATRRAGAAR